MNETRREKGLGCLKDPVDSRDVPISLVLPRIVPPPEVDYTPRMSPVRDQGEEGTCVGFASVVGVKEFQEAKEHGRYIGLSPRFLYSRCKQVDGIPDQEGTYPRLAMKILAEQGVCLETCWPYRPYQEDAPCPDAEIQAASFRIRTYARLGTLAEMERSLAVNGPFLAGVEVFSGWYLTTDGRIPLPAASEQSLGGHAICIVGYSNSGQFFKFKNSWGENWGDLGYGFISYDYMEQYCMDAWSATDLLADPHLLGLLKDRAARKSG